MRKRLIKVFFAYFALSIAVAILSSQTVYAASSGSVTTTVQSGSTNTSITTKNGLKSSKKANVATDTCFDVSASLDKTGTGTNTFAVHGLAQYNCGTAYGGSIDISTTSLCGTTSATVITSLPISAQIYNNPVTTYLGTFTGYCEHCENAVPVSFPFFTETVVVTYRTLVASAGTDITNPDSYTVPASGKSGTISAGFTNSSAYVIPCQ